MPILSWLLIESRKYPQKPITKEEKKMSYNQRILIPLILAKCALISGFTYAQNEITLEEIVVTAQKRAENLQSTPIAVSAFTATTLENKGIDNISELANFTPNLVFDTTSPVIETPVDIIDNATSKFNNIVTL